MPEPDTDAKEDATVILETKHPSKVRLILILIPPVYLLVTCVLYVLGPLTATWSVWQRTLVLTPIMVTCIVGVISPIIQARLGHLILVRIAPKRQG